MKCMHFVWMIIIMYTFIYSTQVLQTHRSKKQNGFCFWLRSLVGSALSSSGQWTFTAASSPGTSRIRVLARKRLVVGATNISWCHCSQHVYLHTYVLCLVHVHCALCYYAVQYLFCLKSCWHNVHLPSAKAIQLFDHKVGERCGIMIFTAIHKKLLNEWVNNDP